METYEIIGIVAVGLSGLIALMVQITRPIIKAVTAITNLTASVDNITAKFDAFTERSHDTHQRLWDKTDEHGKMLADHEKRIHGLETK